MSASEIAPPTDIREHAPILSDEAMSYITQVVDTWPTTNGFPKPPPGVHVQDSIGQEITEAVRAWANHLPGLFTAAENASPNDYLSDMPNYAEAHQRKLLMHDIERQMKGKQANARTFPWRVNDIVKVNKIVVGLHAIIAGGEAKSGQHEETLTDSQRIDRLETEVQHILSHLGLESGWVKSNEDAEV